jgi:hypothetical protein
MWRATTKIWRGLSKFTVWRVVGGKDIGARVPLQTGNELLGEACGLALSGSSISTLHSSWTLINTLAQRYYLFPKGIIPQVQLKIYISFKV